MAEKRTGTRMRQPVIGIKDEPIKETKKKRERKGQHSPNDKIKRQLCPFFSFSIEERTRCIVKISSHLMIIFVARSGTRKIENTDQTNREILNTEAIKFQILELLVQINNESR